MSASWSLHGVNLIFINSFDTKFLCHFPTDAKLKFNLNLSYFSTAQVMGLSLVQARIFHASFATASVTCLTAMIGLTSYIQNSVVQILSFCTLIF